MSDKSIFKPKPLSAAVAAALMGSAMPAMAVVDCGVDTLTVDSPLDTMDSGDGVLTLREAVAAVTNASGCSESDIITFDASLDGQTIELASTVYFDGGKLVDISVPTGKTVTVAPSASNTAAPLFTVNEGAQLGIDGLVFDGNSVARSASLISASGAASLSISNSTIQNSVRGTSAIFNGAVSLNTVSGDVTIDNTTFSGNISSMGGALAAVDSSVTITDSVFRNNTADYYNDGAGPSSMGGAIYFENSAAAGTLTVSGSDFDSNAASSSIDGIPAQGGAIAIKGITGSEVDISDSTFTVNSASAQTGYSQQGGAIDISGSGGTVNIEGSVFDGNSSGMTYSSFGGVFNIADAGAKGLTIINTSLLNNSGYYGAVLSDNVDNSSSIELIQSTASGNTGGVGGVAYMGANYSAITIRQSTLTLNSATNGDVLYGSTEYSISATCDHSAIGDNGSGDDIPASITLDSSNCYIGDGMGLGPLSNDVHTPEAGSPLIDAGDPAYIPYADTDQLGNTRVNGDAIDIGAVESGNESSSSGSGGGGGLGWFSLFGGLLLFRRRR